MSVTYNGKCLFLSLWFSKVVHPWALGYLEQLLFSLEIDWGSSVSGCLFTGVTWFRLCFSSGGFVTYLILGTIPEEQWAASGYSSDGDKYTRRQTQLCITFQAFCLHHIHWNLVDQKQTIWPNLKLRYGKYNIQPNHHQAIMGIWVLNTTGWWI